MAQQKATISHMIDTMNAALVEAEKLISGGTPGGLKVGTDTLQVVTASMQLFIDKSSKLTPEEYQRIFGYRPDR